MCNLYLRSGNLSSTSLRVEYLYKLSGILHRTFVYSYPFIYVCNHLYHYEVMGINFIFWVIIQYFFTYFIVQVIPAFAMGTSFIWLTCFLTDSWHCVVFLLVFFWGIFLLSDTTRCSRLILYISHPSTRICHFYLKPWFPSLENDIRDQDLDTGYIIT